MKPSKMDLKSACVGLTAMMLALNLGAAPLQSGDREKAQAAYRDGNRLLDQGQFSQAAAAYNAAIAEDPQFAQAYHNLALASEMVDRKQAIEAWRRFADVATGKDEFKFDVPRVQARLQILAALPSLPEAIQPSRYVPEAGDYYWQVSRDSEGEEWDHSPLKVFLGSAPEMKWQEGAREAYDFWSTVLPLQLVALPQDADIRLSWERSDFEGRRAGEDREYVEIRRVGEGMKARRIAVISVDMRIRWAKDEMRAVIAHEMGHALGIKGHSDSKKDLMFWQSQEKTRRYSISGIPLPIVWRALVKQPSQRDINTLIRLYNHAGSSVRFR